MFCTNAPEAGGYGVVVVTPERQAGGMDASYAIAAEQHGLVTLQQALATGLSHDQVRHRIAIGAFRPFRRGVLAVGGAPRSWEQAALAAVLASGPDTVTSHETAAALWGFPDVGPGRIELTTARADQRRMRGISTHRTNKFLDCEHTSRHGVPVTSLARTLVDLSARLSRVQLARALDKGLRRNRTTLRAVRICVSGLRPAPGRRPLVIQRLLAERLPGYQPGDSHQEVRVLRVLVDAGLPEGVQQHRVEIDGHRFLLDLAFPEIKLAIEVDGYAVHNTRSSFDHDRARANLLVAEGWTMLRFTSAMTDTEIARAAAATYSALVQKKAA
jgi:very-short-patch-repair endonuclease